MRLKTAYVNIIKGKRGVVEVFVEYALAFCRHSVIHA